MPCGPPPWPAGRYGPGSTGDYPPVFGPFTKLNELKPEWSDCTTAFGWNEWDPPKTLEPATAMVPQPTAADSGKADPNPAAPSPTTPPLPKHTRAVEDPAVKPDPPAVDPSGTENAPDPGSNANPSQGDGDGGNVMWIRATHPPAAISLGATDIVIAGQTLTPGAPTITANGEVVPWDHQCLS